MGKDYSISKNVGFEILKDTGSEIVLKRVLTERISSKKRYEKEMTLPKVVISYFEVEDLNNLQELAANISSRMLEQRDNNNTKFFMRLFSTIRKGLRLNYN